ncbi:hypothetical protein ABA31_04900 [Agrococcus baldri]|uniref:Uncharacterized protein n=1 Tax=Agrococcus baldri TaxID=153730 RepID=A0AA87UR47_9MICO|nr:hypothetical protein ABA31_04900 [Agrococcus baldri]
MPYACSYRGKKGTGAPEPKLTETTLTEATMKEKVLLPDASLTGSVSVRSILATAPAPGRGSLGLERQFGRSSDERAHGEWAAQHRQLRAGAPFARLGVAHR